MKRTDPSAAFARFKAAMIRHLQRATGNFLIAIKSRTPFYGEYRSGFLMKILDCRATLSGIWRGSGFSLFAILVVFACTSPSTAQTDPQEEKETEKQPTPKPIPKAEQEKQTQPAEHQPDDETTEGSGLPKEKSAPEGETEADAEEPAASRPLGNWLGRLLFGETETTSKPSSRNKRLRADPRAPFDSKLSGMLKKAQSNLRANDPRQCAEVLQKLLEQPDDALWEGTPGKLISVRTAAQRLLAKLPVDELERYRLQVAGQAQRDLQAAIGTGTVADLAQVATRYFQTPAGFEAADRLAAKYIDRGEFGLAARWLDELWQSKAPCTEQGGWRLKAEYVAKMVPTTALAKSLQKHSASLPAQATVAGTLVDSRTWLGAIQGRQHETTPTLDNWTQSFGSSRRVGQAVAGEPLLLKRWSQPLSTDPGVHGTIDKLIDDLRDQDQVPILTIDPLLIDGKIIFRSLRGVQVVDAASGNRLWATPDEPSAEDLLAASSQGFSETPESPRLPILPIGQPANVAGEMFEELLDSAPSDHPLTHLLFRNANYGLLSSDGSRIFVIEDQSVLSDLQPGKYQGEDAPEVDLFGRPVGINRLTAYDLRTGRSVWEVGGRELNDPFALPLAGTFIFGPPVVDGTDLFLVNEEAGEIRLQVLDPATGKPRWSQVIGHAQTKIDVDFGRQWFAAQVAVTDGIVVCPTTIGWLVAIDRTTRNILWAYRYDDPSDDEPAEAGSDAVEPAPLNDRWTTAPPVIVGNRVLYTPPESESLVCLDLSDGELEWKRRKGETDLYLAGVFGNQAVIVATTAIYAVDIEKRGKTLWTVKYGSKDALPAGRGVAAQDRYYLPLTNGELLCIPLVAETQARRSATRFKLPPSTQPELQQFGNLAMHRGMLISVGPRGVVAFEPKLSIESELKQQLAANPLSPSALIRKAELELLHDRPRVALDLLHELRAATLTSDLQQRYRAASVIALSALVRSDLKANDTEFDELSQWAQLPAEQQAREMLRAERLIAREDFAAAFEVYLKFAREFGQSLLMPSGASNFQVRGDHWAAGQLEQLWQGAPPESARVIDLRVQELAEVAVTAEISDQSQFLTLFGFHPTARSVRQRMTDALIQKESWQAAENVLGELQLTAETRSWANERLGRLWRQAGFAADATLAYRTLEKEFPHEIVDGKTTADFVKALRDTGELTEPTIRTFLGERNRDLELSHFGSNFDPGNGLHIFSLQGVGLPYFQRNRLQYLPNESRFEVIDTVTENRVWSVPLRLKEDTTIDSVAARVHGHSVVVFGGGRITSLSPMERRVLWSRPQVGRPIHDEDNQLADTDSLGSGQRLTDPLRSLAERGGRAYDIDNPWKIFPQHGGPQVISNQRYVGYLARRQLVVHDAATGEINWERHDLPVSAVVRGGSQLIYVLDLFTDKVTAYRAVDGAKLEIPNLSAECSSALDVVDDDLIRIELPPAKLFSSTSNDFWLTRFNPLTQSKVWRIKFPKTVKFTRISGQRLVLLTAEGELQLCDLKTGTVSSRGRLTPKSLRSDAEVRVIPTFDQLLVIVNQNRLFSEDNTPPESFATIRVHGMIHSFDLTTGKEQWKQNVEGQHLILDQLDYSPVILLMSRRYRPNQAVNWKLSLVAIDRLGGKVVHESSAPAEFSYQTLTFNAADGFVELRAYNDRLRLMPKPD